MRYLDLRKSMEKFPVFSLKEIRKVDSHFHRRRLNEWQEKGYIKKIIRGHYLFSDSKIDEQVLFAIANQIYRPSYISLESALSYFSLIPEIVYGTTSISTRKTCRFSTKVGEFLYRHVKPSLFFGYQILRHDSTTFLIATPEKAILDYLYLHPGLKSKSDFESLRINSKQFLEKIDEKKFLAFAERFSQKRLMKTAHLFWKFMQNA